MSYSEDRVRAELFGALDALGPRKRVLALPPDGSRGRSRAGLVLRLLHEYYDPALTDILPALGTHEAMRPAELEAMFPGLPASLFRVHDWRSDLVTLGRVPRDYVEELSEGRLHFDWPAQVNRLVAQGGHDLVVSIGQVVPHEVAGMANHAKNVFVGTGGVEGIHRSHFLGAVYGMERIMGRTETPVRALFDYASREFARSLPLFYVLTVVGPAEEGAGQEADPVHGDALRGLFTGSGRECFTQAAELSRRLNLQLLDRPLDRAVVRLDPHEFRSTWLGNKSIYRTRMAMADGGELIVLAPGVSKFGEDATIDRLIRAHGYAGTERTLASLHSSPDLAENLSAAAHLIHGSSEGRFSVTYCAGGLSREEVEGAGFGWRDLAAEERRWEGLRPGHNLRGGEGVYFIPNPAAGLWATRERFGGV
jgi:nickel-dependent lactate racemase